jgi:low affinity Fe/Cu permease
MPADFHQFARRVAEWVGSNFAFAAAILIVLAWAATGPLFHFSDTWQLVINTGTTIVTFLMVFLIQNTQNRDALAMHVKLDELLRAVKAARNELVDLENRPERELLEAKRELAELASRAGSTEALPVRQAPQR